MSKVTYHVEFSGRTSIEFDTADFPHYFENGEARGGEAQLAEDLFYDEADLVGGPFGNDGRTEFYGASFEKDEA